jgi:DNA repair exonuclease SbcCD nuclease subunit
MHLLLIGDPHFRVDNITETQKFQDSVVKTISDLLAKSKLHYVIVLGDILHTHEKLNTFALNVACKFFDAIRALCPMYVLVGNHDATSNTIFLEDTHWMNALKHWAGITIVDKPTRLSETIMCPYVPDGRFVEALGKFFSDWKTSKYIIGHQLLNGAKMGPIVAANVEEWEPDFPMCISGHIHDKQRPRKNLYYVGSSMQHAFGESADKTITWLDTTTGEMEEIALDIPRKQILYVDADDVESVVEKVQNAPENMQYKIVLKGDAASCKAAKNSTVLKALRDSKSVKSVQLKETNIAAQADSNVEKNFQVEESHTFEKTLREIVNRRDDPFVESLLNWCMGVGEDLSDKPGFTL